MDNQEINTLINEYVKGYYYLKGGIQFTTDIKDVFGVVHYLLENIESNFYEWNFELNHIQGVWYAMFEIDHFKESKRFYGYGDTPEMAICNAILKMIKEG